MNQPITNASSQNPYSAPRSQNISGSDEDLPQEVKIFSTSGRIGRARYVVYLFGLSILIMVGGFLLSLITAGIAMIPAYIALVVIQFMLTIQRCHDFDATGWLSLLIFVPLVNFMFIFIPGTKGTNRWGSKTIPNSTPMVIGAWLCALVFPLGILAAIAVPQYQTYVERAKATQAR